eukprot:jgi/Bigna1/137435/aug1.39_g12143
MTNGRGKTKVLENANIPSVNDAFTAMVKNMQCQFPFISRVVQNYVEIIKKQHNGVHEAAMLVELLGIPIKTIEKQIAYSKPKRLPSPGTEHERSSSKSHKRARDSASEIQTKTSMVEDVDGDVKEAHSSSINDSFMVSDNHNALRNTDDRKTKIWSDDFQWLRCPDEFPNLNEASQDLCFNDSSMVSDNYNAPQNTNDRETNILSDNFQWLHRPDEFKNPNEASQDLGLEDLLEMLPVSDQNAGQSSDIH